MTRLKHLANCPVLAWLFICFWTGLVQASTDSTRHEIPTGHPRLLGSLERLKELAIQRPEAYARTANVARNMDAGDHPKMISMALVCAIEGDSGIGKQAIEKAMECINGPIRVGHVTFGHDLARCAIVYDLCYDYWTEEERNKFHDYMNATVDANVNHEIHVFGNAWYGYKHWGIGLACYATWYENPRAEEILAVTEHDYRTQAAPALEMAGDGGGWAEGYYINYFSYEWLFFCEAAHYCEGLDYYEIAPRFFRNRAVASMFEAYPGIREYNSRRPIPMGDSGGRIYGGDRDKALSARRILVSRYRDDPAHRCVHTFNETTPRSASGTYAYKDLLWRDTTVVKGDLDNFKLSHYSPGPGYVYARSSWDEDATYFFFKCGDRFTSHQHLDNGHFLICKYEELAGDGGHYDSFGSSHDVNYHLRTIAHNTILVHNQNETWPSIRAGNVTGNDGGQTHDWPHHNGAIVNPAEWERGRDIYDIADILEFEDQGSYLYVAGDCSRAYSSSKLEHFTRQIVFIRPGTFVIFDRVESKSTSFKKTWLLQAMKTPTGAAPNLQITNGKGRLFIQTVLPSMPVVKLFSDSELYSYGGRSYPPNRDTGTAPECRIEISPLAYKKEDYFLHVLLIVTMTSVPVTWASACGTEDVVESVAVNT
ncbi:MAG: heparinase II/III family protein [Gemmatimonadota bacterium]|nr:heparinase II/III family protein [Gemmatimonadota bacterium]